MERIRGRKHAAVLAACAWLILAPALFPQPAASGEKVVKVATLTDFPPHCFGKGSGSPLLQETIPPGGDSSRLQGYAWDVVRESYHAAGYTILLQVVPWSRAMHYVETGKANVVFPAMKTEEREKRFAFSEEPVIHTAFLVYVPASTRIEWNGLESLEGKRIVGVKGWAFGRDWEANKDIVKMEAYTILQGFEMVSKGWVFGIAGYDVPFDYVLREEGLTGRFKKLPSWGSTEEYVLAAKTRKETREILRAFDLGKRTIQKNGTLEAIRVKWR